MKLLNVKIFKSALSYILVFSMVLTYFTSITPKVAAVNDEPQTVIPAEISASPTEEQPVRDLDELKANENVLKSSDGKTVYGIRSDESEEFSPNEIKKLLGTESVREYTEEEIKQIQVVELNKQFGLSEEDIEQGIDSHGDVNAFKEELISFNMSKDYANLSSNAEKDIVTLIENGYTNSQAFAANVASGVLGISIEELARIRAAEIESEKQKTEEIQFGVISIDEENETPKEQDEEYLKLSIKMGVTYSVIESFMKNSSKSTKKLEEEYDYAKKAAYPIINNKNVDNEADKHMSGELSLTSQPGKYYYPESILEKPFTYDTDGNVDVNLNTGDYSYTETDLNIPGINGLNLVINRSFNSKYADNGTPYSWINEDYANDDCLSVGFTPYQVVNSGSGSESYVAITDFSQYVLCADANVLFQNYGYYFNFNNPNYDVRFKAHDYKKASSLYQSLGTIFTAATYQGDNVYIEFRPFIKGIEPVFSNACKNEAAANNYCVDTYGLGHGWMLGFSGIETYYAGFEDGLKKRLFTSDGKKYEIDFCAGGSNLVDYKLRDMIIEDSGNGYSGARYTLTHKDGKKEYFDSNGRNIAIVDRYGNAITLAYTLTSDGKVSKIKITDTLGNNIVYADSNIDSSVDHYVDGIQDDSYRYRTKWILSVNGKVIREYYSTLFSGLRLLKVVGNEKREYTLYSGSDYGEYYRSLSVESFNCFIPRVSSNDGLRSRASVIQIRYPNRLIQTIMPISKKQRLGLSGYQKYCSLVLSFEVINSDTNVFRYKGYEYEDFSQVDTIYYQENYTYKTTVSYFVQKLFPRRAYNWYETKTELIFNNDGLKTDEKKYCWPTIQDYQTMNEDTLSQQLKNFDSKKQLYSKNSLTYNAYDLPATENITNYDYGSSVAGMTENHAYTYDAKGNILTETKPNGQVVTRTYDDNCGTLLTQSYNKDATTTVLVENTLTADGKGVAASTTKENNIIKAKTEYSYGGNGNLTGEKDYTDSEKCVEKQFVYGNNAQITESKTLGVKDVGGSLVVGSPGYAAGIVATKTDYNMRGWPTAQTDASRNVTSIEYDETGKITNVTNPDNSTASYVYDVANKTATMTDELGNTIRNTYNSLGSLTETFDVTGKKKLLSKNYDFDGRLCSETMYSISGNDKTNYYYYDHMNRVIEKGTKNTNGTLLSQETYVYLDGTGKTTKTIVGDTNAPAVVTTEYKNNMGLVTAMGRLLNGVEYQDTYTYDYLGNRLTEKTPYTTSIGGTVTNTYTYDCAGRVLSSKDALNHTASKTYDWLGNQVSETDYSGNVTLYTYDALGRLLEKRQPFSSNNGTISYAENQYRYDLNGNVTTQKTANSAPGVALSFAQTDYAYDNRNRLATVTAYDGGAAENYTQYYYDALGNTLRMYTGLSSPLNISGLDTVSGADTNYSVTKYAYDRFGNMLTKTDPLNQTETYTYDINGSALTKTDRNGNVTTFAYDAMGRVTNSTVTTPDGKGNAILTYAYTLAGQKLSESNGTESTSYVYDSLGRATQETSGATVKAYGYNLGGNRTSFTLLTNGTQQFNTNYTFDELNRLTGTTEGTVTSTYGYDTNGNRSYVQYNNGLREEYAYNLANHLTALLNKNSSNTVLSQYTYTYGLDGNQLTKTDKNGKVTAYSYDDLGRLTGESESTSGSVSQAFVYAYDDSNNRSTLTATGANTYTTAYSYDVDSRLLSEVRTTTESTETTNYNYDPNGNQISKASETISAGTGNSSASLSQGVAGCELSKYNGFNQLVETNADGVTATYTYAPSGLRTSKTAGDIKTDFVLDGDNVVLELASGALTSKYIRGINLICSTIGADTNYYLYNGHGDVVQLANESGIVTRTYEYDAFGNEKKILLAKWGDFDGDGDVDNTDKNCLNQYVSGAIISLWEGSMTAGDVNGDGHILGTDVTILNRYLNGTLQRIIADTNGDGYINDAVMVNYPSDTAKKDPNPYRYCGEYLDLETNTYYLRARNYDPTTGRFLSEDTYTGKITDPLSLNLYTYCEGDPVNNTDPTGHFVNVLIGAGVGAVVGGTIAAISQYATTGQVDWKRTAIAAGAGAITGALAATGVGLVGQVVANAAVGATSDFGDQLYTNKGDVGKINMKSVALSGTIGAVAGVVGGSGAKVKDLTGVYNTSKNVLKTAVSPKKIAMYTTKKSVVIKSAIITTGRFVVSNITAGGLSYAKSKLPS